MKRALVKVGYACNSRCVFCHSHELRRRFPDLSTAALKGRIAEAARLGADMVVFSGGEPTIRPDILELASAARERGLSSGLVTNGRRFVYRPFLDEMVGRGLAFVYMSFHSPRRDAHRATTRTDSALQTLAALRHLAGSGVELVVNIVVTAWNIGHLDEVVDAAAAHRPSRLKLSIIEPKGAALEAPGCAPRLEEAAAAVSRALERARLRHPGAALSCEGLTPCLLDGWDQLDDDLLGSGFTLFREAFEDRFVSPDRLNRAHAPACADCSRLEDCPGVFRGYLPGAPVRPLSQARPNSFVFVPRGPASPRPRSAGACPARDAEAGVVFLEVRGRARPYATPTRDFPAGRVEAARRAGQVYLSARGRHRRLDYARDLVKLAASPLCRRCPEREGCSRLLRPAAAGVFERLDASLRRLVGGLRGDVLEVGCGPVRFRRELAAAARRGRIRYLGIDPGLSREEARGGLRVLPVSAEEYDAPDASFDAALMLRSYNHLRTPSAVFPKLRRLLRPGGRLVVVDGAPFGVLLPRVPAQARPGDHEHFRNHGCAQARRALEGFGFRVVREVPESSRGSMEWLLEGRAA